MQAGLCSQHSQLPQKALNHLQELRMYIIPFCMHGFSYNASNAFGQLQHHFVPVKHVASLANVAAAQLPNACS
jgi:hypothetical protein